MHGQIHVIYVLYVKMLKNVLYVKIYVKIIIVFSNHGLNIITIVLLFHCNFLSIVGCYLLKWALMIFEENMLVREFFSK